MVTQPALPLLWPNWFTWGENGFSLARSRFNWQPWHWLQRWGGTVIVGGTVGSTAGQRPHTHTDIHIQIHIQTHTHKYKYRHTLCPSLCPLRSGDRPSSHAPVFPRGAQTCCAIRSSSRLFSPPSALISSYLMHLRPPPTLRSPFSPPLQYHCHTTRIRNIKTILLISGLWPSSKSLPSFFRQPY